MPHKYKFFAAIIVAPLAGARIEIYMNHIDPASHPVAPLAGARIEMFYICTPMRLAVVAPLAGARIEMILKYVSTA